MSSTTRLATAGGIATFLAMVALVPATDSASWLIPAGMLIALLVAVGVAGRRFGVPRLLIPPVQFAVAALWLGLFVASDVAFLGVVPTWAWIGRLGEVFGEGFNSVYRYAAPVPLERGIFALVIGGTALVATMVDLLAASFRRVTLAGLPLASIYAVSASVVPGGVSWALFVPVAAGFLVLLVAERRYTVAHWGRMVTLSERRSQGEPQAASLARNGRRVGAVAIIAAIVIPALLPGLPEVVFGRGGGGSGGIIRTTNPIVDLKRDLVRPDNVELFRYASDDRSPDYIRTTTLDVFTGERWQPSKRDVGPNQRVSTGLPNPPGLDPEVGRTTVTTDFTVRDNLHSEWLPLPYPPAKIRIEGDWRYDAATLDVVNMSGETTSGIDYSVESYSLDIDARSLRAASGVPEGLETLTELPDSLPPVVAELAVQITSDATNNFDRAAALQEWFRSSGGFTYDLTTRPGHSNSALLDFLNDKRGYCEQFAATMAIMARSLNIPARVVTGYLPGSRVADNEWVVRAHDAHAWPELYFTGVGWVRFEPTPQGRTGVAPSWTIPPVDTPEASDAPTAEPAAPDNPGGQNNSAADRPDVDEFYGQGQLEEGFPWQRVVGGFAIAMVLATPAMTAWTRRRLRWRAAQGDPGREAEAAWADLRDTVRDAGLPWDPAKTPRWTAQRLVDETELAEPGKDLLQHVVHATETARYARSHRPVEGLREDSLILRRAILAGRPRRHRIRATVWPSGMEDVMSATANRMADGMDWLDAAGERMRGALMVRLERRKPQRTK